MEFSLCIAGCGKYAKTVLDEVRGMSDEIQFFFASRDLDRARRYCDIYGGAGCFGSYEDAASDPRVNALYFITPHHLHPENALLAARNSKHILMEKPIARTIPEARDMIAAAREAAVKLMVAENFRFLPTVSKCKELIEEDAIGDLRLIEVQTEAYDEAVEWRANATHTGGGRIIDGGIHCVDALLNIGGFPEKVYGAVLPRVLDMEGEDGMVITAHLPRGAVGLVHYSGGTAISERRDWMKVTGTKGQVSFEALGSEVVLDTLEGKRTIQVQAGERVAMLLEFRDCVLEDREPVMSGEEGLRDLAVVLAAYRSVEQGAAVTVSPP